MSEWIKIDEDTVQEVEVKTIKISELETRLAELQAIQMSVEADNAFRETLPDDKKHLIVLMPDQLQEIERLQLKINELKELDIQ